MLKPIHAAVAGIGSGEPEIVMNDEGIRHVFKVLHGFYGNLFLSKWQTGTTDDSGEDQGIANARRIWAYSLREHAIDDIKLALRRCQTVHTEFPPSLPQFLALCDAIKPRPVSTAIHPNFRPELTMSPEARAAWRAEQRRKATEAAHRQAAAAEPTGLDVLKQCIATAARDAGGDEVATLLQLDRIFTPARKS